MDLVQQAVDLAVMLAAANPKAAAVVGGLSALYAAIQGLGFACSRLFPAHTIAARVGQRVAAFPVRIKAPAVRDPALDAQGAG